MTLEPDPRYRAFGDLGLVEPGIARLCGWWPDGPNVDPSNPVDDILIGGVGRKP